MTIIKNTLSNCLWKLVCQISVAREEWTGKNLSKCFPLYIASLQRPVVVFIPASQLIGKTHKSSAMKLILKNFLVHFELRLGCYLLGAIDWLLYGCLSVVFSLQNFTDWELIEAKYGETLEQFRTSAVWMKTAVITIAINQLSNCFKFSLQN